MTTEGYLQRKPMKFAFVDPPYLGCCKLYQHRHEAPYGCWDDPATHQQLIDWVCGEFPEFSPALAVSRVRGRLGDNRGHCQ